MPAATSQIQLNERVDAHLLRLQRLSGEMARAFEGDEAFVGGLKVA